MDTTENVVVDLGELHEEKMKKRKSKKRKMNAALSADENLETVDEKLGGEMKDSGTMGTSGTDIRDAVGKKDNKKPKKPKKKDLSIAVNTEQNLQSEGGKLASQTYIDGLEKKKDKSKSKKRKMKAYLSADENLETVCEKLGGETKDSGVVETSGPEIGDDVEKKDNKKSKKSKKKALSIAVNKEQNLQTEGDELASQTHIDGLEQKTEKRKSKKSKMKAALSADENLETVGEKLGGEIKDSVVAETSGTEIGDAVEKKDNKKSKKSKKKALSVAVNKEQNLQTVGDKLASQIHIDGLEQKTEKRKSKKSKMKAALSADENLETVGEKLGGETKDSGMVETTGTEIGDAVERKDNKKPKKLDKKALSVAVNSEQNLQTEHPLLLELTENPTACKKKRVKRKHKLSNVSKLDLIEVDGEKDGIMESSSVNDGDSMHCREGNNLAPGEDIPLADSISKVAVPDGENSDTCKKKLTKKKRKLSSVSQSELNDKDGEKDRNVESMSVNDGENNNFREGNDVAQGEGIPLTDSISVSDSIKDACRPVSEGEAIHERLLPSSPKTQIDSPPRRKLLILDINGLLADIVAPVPFGYKPDLMLSRKAVFKRPFCESFLKFCFEKFDVGVWSSRVKINVDKALNFLMGEMKNKLVFYWDRSHCTITRFPTIDNRDKPLVLKELRKLWDDHQFHLGKYDQKNTLLLDDSPYKALCNPDDTGIFPVSYQYKDVNDCSLGPGGDLRDYLEKLALADNIPEFVRNNPFGQSPIRNTNLSWNYYKKVIDSLNSRGK